MYLIYDKAICGHQLNSKERRDVCNLVSDKWYNSSIIFSSMSIIHLSDKLKYLMKHKMLHALWNIESCLIESIFACSKLIWDNNYILRIIMAIELLWSQAIEQHVYYLYENCFSIWILCKKSFAGNALCMKVQYFMHQKHILWLHPIFTCFLCNFSRALNR